jgi:threonine dehydrogenase-like Zn-dependent dehydrogenase
MPDNRQSPEQDPAEGARDVIERELHRTEPRQGARRRNMKAAVFLEPGRIVLDERPVPEIGPLDALLRVTTTTICGTDIHIRKGEYPVRRGLVIGHEPVGIVEQLGSAVAGFQEGQRVIAGAITPSGYSNACLCGCWSQDGAGTRHGFKAIGGWKFGNTIDGCQAEYLLVPDAMANLAPVPPGLSDEQVLMCPDIMSTGFSGAESGNIQIGDTVAVFAQGPIGLCATAGAKLRGATAIIAVESVPTRMEVSRRLGADHIVDFRAADPVQEIMRLTDGRGVDVAIEALGTQATFEAALRVLRPGGTLSSLGVYSSDLTIPVGPFASGLADLKIVTTLCPGGKERMQRLMAVIASRRADLTPLVTHRFRLDQIEEAYDLFGDQRDGVLKVAITP